MTHVQKPWNELVGWDDSLQDPAVPKLKIKKTPLATPDRFPFPHNTILLGKRLFFLYYWYYSRRLAKFLCAMLPS
jgi:hypothetical protein